MAFPNYMSDLLAAAYHEMSQHISLRLKGFELTPGQYDVLSYLWLTGEASPGDVARALSLESSAVSGLLDRMEKKGLIVRNRDATDRRSIRVAVTERGMAIEPGVRQVIEEVNHMALRELSPENQDRLLHGLRTIGQVS